MSDEVARFKLLAAPPFGFPPDAETRWWLDTARPTEPAPPDFYQFIAVQVRAALDPNNFRRIEGELALLFTDEAEYYAVCSNCHLTHAEGQWTGGTEGRPGWRLKSEIYRLKHQQEKGWCEFCDPIFGNGGWAI